MSEVIGRVGPAERPDQPYSVLEYRKEENRFAWYEVDKNDKSTIISEEKVLESFGKNPSAKAEPVKAVWHSHQGDLPITVVDIYGHHDDEIFYKVEESKAGIPRSEIEFPKQTPKAAETEESNDLDDRVKAAVDAKVAELRAEFNAEKEELKAQHAKELAEERQRSADNLENEKRHSQQMLEIQAEANARNIEALTDSFRTELAANRENPVTLERRGRLGTVLAGLALVGVVALIALEGVDLGKNHSDPKLRKEVTVQTWKTDQLVKQNSLLQHKVKNLGIRISNLSTQNKAILDILASPKTGLKKTYVSVHRYGNHLLNQTKKHRLEDKAEDKKINKAISEYMTTSVPKTNPYYDGN